MAAVATVVDLLDSLDYGKSTVEQDIIDALRQRFEIPTSADLPSALQREAPGDVLTAILELLRPFAFMIFDIYGFLGEAAVRTEGNLEVHVPLGEAERLKLNVKVFREIEQQVVEAVLGSEFDPSLLPREGQWRIFHDGYWPPDCAEEFSSGRHLRPCRVCPPGTLAADFGRFTRYFDELDRIAAEQMRLPEQDRLPSPTTFDWESIRRRWSECRRRQARALNVCSMEKEWVLQFFTAALREFDAAKKVIGVADIRRFLALPYWRQRWQLYEVWFVMLVLRSYGLSKLTLRTTDQQWKLAVGSVDPQPIATSRLCSGDVVEFYYQFQGVPPSALFPGTLDRPEILVQQKSASGRPLQALLVAEVKARRSYGPQDMKGALFSLREWNSKAIVGSNYFDMGSGRRISVLDLDGIQIVAADECKPRSDTAKELTDWLVHFWRRELGSFISVVLIDTSGSMPERLLPRAVSYVRERVSREPTAELLIATFRDSTRFLATGELEAGALDLRPHGGTALARAVADCREALQTKFPAAGRLSVHVLTDLNVGNDDIEELLRWAATSGTTVRVYAWSGGKVSKHLQTYPELASFIEYLPA